MISLTEQQKRISLWIGVLLLLFGGIWAIIQGSSPITAGIAIIGFILILIWKLA
ncbi:hypothetical protein [Methanobacterium sp. ACI-7]|uniref:hypothetical protein n=1 Tax=unclassified Methanobacterium TaxID=2627676 RepID=UPI0039C056ED